MTRWSKVGFPALALFLATLGLVAWTARAAEKGKVQEKRKDPFGFLRHPPAHLGVTLEDVGPDDVPRLKLPAERGAIVKDVRPDTPAAQAGVKEGDVIVRFQGEVVQSAAQLTRLVAETPPGRKVEIEVQRDGNAATLQATLDERRMPFADGFDMPEPPDPPRMPDIDTEAIAGKARAMIRNHGLLDAGPPRLGITFQEVSGQLGRYFKVPGEEGLLVTSVNEGSPAEAAGLRAGDVIVKVAGHEVRDADALREHVGQAEAGASLDVTVLRDGRSVDVSVKLGGQGPSS